LSLIFRTNFNNNNQNSRHFRFIANQSSTADANCGTLNISNTLGVSSGNTSFIHLELTPTYNTTGSYSGTATGIDYNPTLTSTTGLTHYGLLVRPTSALNGLGVSTPTAVLHVAASTTSRASLRIDSGTAPTSPNDGDIWFDGTDIKIRVGGVTKTFTLV
jgi:hypothetical protein